LSENLRQNGKTGQDVRNKCYNEGRFYCDLLISILGLKVIEQINYLRKGETSNKIIRE
jgi:hypothetical protein